jgi:hypothetical protein
VPFGVTTTSLPNATPGTKYLPTVTLQADGIGTSAPGYTTTLKWAKVSLPKGLKLSSKGCAVRYAEQDPGCWTQFSDGEGDRNRDHPRRDEEGQDQDNRRGHHSADDHITQSQVCSGGGPLV